MDTKCLFFTLCVILAFGSISCQLRCATYSCGNLDDGLCSLRNTTENAFVLKQCSSDTPYCPFSPADEKEYCTTKPKALYYPETPCENNSTCLYGDCVSKVCEYTKANEKCTKKYECGFGYACLKNSTDGTDKFCLPQLELNATCSEDSDCKAGSACFNSTCTAFFTQADESTVSNANLCQSGFVAAGKCKTLKNQGAYNQTCNFDVDCKYTDSANSTITYAGACQCGFNKDTNMYCAIGSGEAYFVDYIAKAKEALKSLGKCNAVEKSFVCAEKRRTERSVNYRKSLQALGNSAIMANYAKFANADQCVKYVALNFDESIVKPDTYSCPKYTCTTGGSSCLASTNPFTDGGIINVNLTTGVCQKNQTCAGLDKIYDESTVAGKCVDKSIVEPTEVRFPGEDCEKNSDCFADFGKNGTCTDKKCAGVEVGKSCNKTVECLVGNFCSSNGTCTAQLSVGGKCSSIYECANNLACYKGSCVEFGSVKSGEELTNNTIGDFFDDERKFLLCEFGQNNETACTQKLYHADVEKNANSDGYIKCNKGDKCLYSNGIVEYCGCGYNADGQGYCPLSQKYSKI